MSSVQSDVDWQSKKNTVLERNRHTFNNPEFSDISFTCEGSKDTDERSLTEFLRFLYTDKCNLITDNVVSVMYLSEEIHRALAIGEVRGKLEKIYES